MELLRRRPGALPLLLLALLPAAGLAQTVDTAVGYNSVGLCTTTSQVAGEFFVTTVPGEASVVADGSQVGTTSSTVPGSLRVSLSPGEHTIQISKKDYSTYTIRACIQNSKTTFTEVRLNYQPGSIGIPTPIPSGSGGSGGSKLCYFRADPSVALTSTRTQATLDQDIILPLSIINPSPNDCDMIADLVISVPSGISVEGTGFTLGGSNQFIGKFTLTPGDHKNIDLRVKANEPGKDRKIEGRATYYPKDNKDAYGTYDVSVKVTFLAPVPSAVASVIKDTDPRPSPGMEFPLALAALAALALLQSAAGRKPGR